MNKCDFCDFGGPEICGKEYYSLTRENSCRKATIKMQDFFRELAEKGAVIKIG